MELCGALHPQQVFSYYAYGDPLPVYARFVAEEDETEREEAITVYVACQREAGHTGKHLSTANRGWFDEDRSSEQMTEVKAQ